MFLDEITDRLSPVYGVIPDGDEVYFTVAVTDVPWVVSSPNGVPMTTWQYRELRKTEIGVVRLVLLDFQPLQCGRLHPVGGERCILPPNHDLDDLWCIAAQHQDVLDYRKQGKFMSLTTAKGPEPPDECE